MTTDTDKLIQVAEAAGFRVVRFNDADAYACDDEGKDITPKLAGFRTAIIASLCGDVEQDGFHLVSVNAGFTELLEALDRADRKGYMPDAIYSAYEGFECRDPASTVAAIIADLCGNVEPVAFMFQHSETGRITFVDAWQKENGWAAGNPRFFEVDALVPASTLAAAQALNAELVARLEGLEKDAARYRWLRDGEIVADYPYPVMRMGGSRVDDQTIWADELDAAIDDAISAAQHPQQEQP